MPDSKKEIQQALLDGVAAGHSGEALLQFAKRATKAKDKKIVHVAFFALSDPDLKDRKVLDTLFELGLSHRLRSDDDEGDDETSSKAASLPLPEKIKKKRAKKS